MSKFLFYFLFFSLNCKAPLNHWEMALNKFIIIIIIIIIIIKTENRRENNYKVNTHKQQQRLAV